MGIWFLENLSRLDIERDAISRLERDCGWLLSAEWGLDGKGLYVDAVIGAHGHEYQVRMTYPDLFPAVPPIAAPMCACERWSDHQYSTGILCLEWGPDIWHPDVTGAQILESAHRLLDIENPKGSAEKITAPSRHQLSLGQEARGHVFRFYLGNELQDVIANVRADCLCDLYVRSHLQEASILLIVQSINADGKRHSDPCIPPRLRGSESEKNLIKGILIKTDQSGSMLEAIRSKADLLALIDGLHVEVRASAKDYLSGDGHRVIIATDSEGKLHLLDILEADNIYHGICISCSTDRSAVRILDEYADLASKKVGIVGLGSVGSKIADSLARTGVSHLHLQDEDIFLPENICRHILDWRNVGEHKVDGIQGRLEAIIAEPEISASRVHITGQESTAALSAALNKIGECDILIDATGDPQVFNIIASVAAKLQRPMVWMEVYAGGIGGMIARARPQTDPDPSTMRQVYHSALQGMPPSDMVSNGRYAAEDSAGRVFAATDADVSVIAYHSVRLAVDTLIARQPSSFPYSMYLIGLQRAWVFDAPFVTIPIETDQWVHRPQTKVDNGDVATRAVEFISSLLESKSGESDHS